MINDSGTMTGGGGRPRGGRMCLGTAAPRSLDAREAAAELAEVDAGMAASAQVWACLCGILNEHWGMSG